MKNIALVSVTLFLMIIAAALVTRPESPLQNIAAQRKECPFCPPVHATPIEHDASGHYNNSIAAIAD